MCLFLKILFYSLNFSYFLLQRSGRNSRFWCCSMSDFKQFKSSLTSQELVSLIINHRFHSRLSEQLLQPWLVPACWFGPFHMSTVRCPNTSPGCSTQVGKKNIICDCGFFPPASNSKVNSVSQWIVFLLKGVMGAVIAPLTLLGGPLMIRAAWYTAGIVGGLSTVAMCAPSEKFLNMGGPLAVGFGVVFASSLG